MKSRFKNGMALLVTVASIHAYAQKHADIGVNLSNPAQNRLQIQFRTPLKNDAFKFRLTLTSGVGHYAYGDYKLLLNTDSLDIFKRSTTYFSNVFDLRVGLERDLKWDFISVHADVIGGYFASHSESHTYYDLTDDNGSMYTTLFHDPDVPYYYYSDPATSWGSWTADYVSAGLAVGASLNVPFYRFLLGINLNYSGTAAFRVNDRRYEDPANDFGPRNEVKWNHYPAAGVSLRYVLGESKKQ